MQRTTLSQHLESMSSTVPDAGDLSVVIGAIAAIGRELSRLVADASAGAARDSRAVAEEPRAVQSARDASSSSADHSRSETIGPALVTRAGEIVRQHLAATGRVAMLVSTARIDADEICAGEHARFVVHADPLEGVSDHRTDPELGSIFGVYRRDPRAESHRSMQCGGAEQVAAGYLLYGADTMFVFTTGAGVRGYTLDRARDEFVLTHDRLRYPDRGGVLAADLRRALEWPHEIREFVEHVTQRSPLRHRYTLRYGDTVVANLHQSLLRGGVAFCPPDRDHENGALQLLGDCAPLAMLAEQAGGKASTGHDRILDLRAYSLHERSPLVIGAAADVELFERFLCGRGYASND